MSLPIQSLDDELNAALAAKAAADAVALAAKAAADADAEKRERAIVILRKKKHNLELADIQDRDIRNNMKELFYSIDDFTKAVTDAQELIYNAAQPQQQSSTSNIISALFSSTSSAPPLPVITKEFIASTFKKNITAHFDAVIAKTCTLISSLQEQENSERFGCKAAADMISNKRRRIDNVNINDDDEEKNVFARDDKEMQSCDEHKKRLMAEGMTEIDAMINVYTPLSSEVSGYVRNFFTRHGYQLPSSLPLHLQNKAEMYMRNYQIKLKKDGEFAAKQLLKLDMEHFNTDIDSEMADRILSLPDPPTTTSSTQQKIKTKRK